jgi:hypothetical protein
MNVKNGYKDEYIIQWVTIITIFLFASFPYEMVQLSETSLGKLYCAFIIAYYSMVDPVYGVIACSIVILYYQLDLYNSIIAVHRDTLLSENMVQMRESMTTLKPESEKKYESYVSGDSFVHSYTPFSDIKDTNEMTIMDGSRKKELLDNFRKANCDDKKRLKSSGGVVRPEMADHVFREIHFPSNSAKCNPCDESCEFSIIEERLNREEKLRPESSKDKPIDWNQLFGHYLVKPITSMADDIFSFEENMFGLIRDNVMPIVS